MKQYYLKESSPAKEFCDGYYLGNGRLGMTAMGGAPQEELYINDDTLWSGSERFHLNEQHYERFREAQRLTLEGRVKEANNIINTDMEGRWFETYLPLASLYITNGQKNNRRNMPLKMVIEPTEGDITDYERQLDINRAVAQVTWKRDGLLWKREYFVSYPHNAAFVYCTVENGGKKELNLAFGVKSKLHDVNGAARRDAFLTGIAPDHAEPSYTSITPSFLYQEPEQSNALRFACCARVIDCDGSVWSDGARVYVNDASYVLIAVKAATNYAGFEQPRDPDPGKVLKGLTDELDLLEKEYKGYEALTAEHIKDYQSLYNRVDLDLGDGTSGKLPTTARLACCEKGVDDPSLAALFFQYARYLTIAGSRKGSQALNLQGIWNDTMLPPWSSNYTNNINVQMNYWPCEKGGLPECHLPLMEMLKELSVAGRKTAEGYYHSGGWVVHHNTDLWRSSEPSCEDASWSWWPFGGAWMCEHIWTHYAYTKDREFLREMYPVLREAAVFMMDFLTENKDGYLVTAPSLSPENKFFFGNEEEIQELVDEIAAGSRCSPNHDKISAVTMGSAMDMSILRELFSNVIEAAQILGIEEDELPEKLAAAMKRFPPYRTGKYGQLLEWYEDYEECTPGMGHISHMYPVYPGNLITPEKTPKLMEAARRSLERRQLHSEREAGWPGAWRISLMARFHNPLECGHLLKSTGARLGAGLMTDKNQQIDAIFGLGAGVGEMLLQSSQSYIELLPAIPVDWQKGSFCGLRARGGFAVSVSWDNCLIRTATVLSMQGGTCRIKANGLMGVCEAEGKMEEGILTFHTEPGKEYTLCFSQQELAGREYMI